MAVRSFLLFLCLVLFFIAVPVFQAPAETIEEYKERMKKEQEEAEQKKKKNRGEEENAGSPDLSGLCNCLASVFQVMASTDVEISIEDANDTPDYDANPDGNDDSDESNVTPPPDGSPENGAEEHTTEASSTEEKSATDSAAEKSPVGPLFPNMDVSLSGSYLFGQETPVFDVTGRFALNVEFFHANIFYQYLGDTTGSSLNTFSANIGFVFPFSNVVSSVYGGVLWQVELSVCFSFGIDLKIAFSESFFLEISSLFAFHSPFYFIILSPSLNVAFDHFTLGAGFNFYDYSAYIQYGPTVSLGLWF
jgi:hypothetical protein